VNKNGGETMSIFRVIEVTVVVVAAGIILDKLEVLPKWSTVKAKSVEVYNEIKTNLQ